MSMRTFWIACALASAPVLAGGCTVITSSDDFEERQPALSCGNDLETSVVDMRLDLTDMNAHEDNLVQADLVEVGPLARRQVGRVVYDPLGAANLTLALPCAVADGNHDVDLVADLTNDRMFEECVLVAGDPIPSCADHQWRLRLQADGTLAYQHDTDFTDVVADPAMPRGALPLRAVFANVDAYAGMMMEMRVRVLESDGTAQETIFVYRRQEIPPATTPLMIEPVPNLVMRNERFKIAIWIDTNMNGEYDPPSAGRTDRDFATIIDGLADAPGPVDPGGLRIVLDANALPPETDVRF
ncbi:MAG: hypothetical protein M3Y87_31465 [Myxococcota bacterium]|nr:hypothetical protein [Myxococcota bacterium]